MKLFLSWSGETSRQVATVLHEWMPYMLHAIHPFISSGDISKGDRWSDVIAEELRDAQYGIICVTPYNLHKPWMNFEAGVLTRVIKHACVTPFLFRVDRADVNGPLSQFQSTEFTKDDTFSLVYSINKNLAPELHVDKVLLRRNVDYWWEHLKKDLDQIPETSTTETRAFYPWLRTFNDLAIYDVADKNACRTIWFVTNDLFKYALRDEVRAKVVENLKHIKYRYVFPEPVSADEIAAKNDLERMKEQSSGRLEYRGVARDLFTEQAASDYIMIESACDRRPTVFVRLPTDANACEYWVDAEERAAKGFFRRFMQLWTYCDAVCDVSHAKTSDLLQTQLSVVKRS
jgi:hypothetical protein